jgi:TonB family protein
LDTAASTPAATCPPPDSTAERLIGTMDSADSATLAAQTFMAHQVRLLPRAINPPKPDYPDSLRVAGIEGTVVLQAVIQANGRADEASIKVIKKLHPALDSAAVEALMATQFSPGLSGDRPVRVMMQVPYTFKATRDEAPPRRRG